jgi:hypothetical protein
VRAWRTATDTAGNVAARHAKWEDVTIVARSGSSMEESTPMVVVVAGA